MRRSQEASTLNNFKKPDPRCRPSSWPAGRTKQRRAALGSDFPVSRFLAATALFSWPLDIGLPDRLPCGPYAFTTRPARFHAFSHSPTFGWRCLSPTSVALSPNPADDHHFISLASLVPPGVPLPTAPPPRGRSPGCLPAAPDRSAGRALVGAWRLCTPNAQLRDASRSSAPSRLGDPGGGPTAASFNRPFCGAT